ncbi:MAG: hypothetical protein QNK75_02230 [Crocinitomicaceae bacterium]
MNFKIKLGLIALIGAMAFTACKKKETPEETFTLANPITAQASLQDLKNFLSDNLENAKQSFTINEDAGATITGAQGTTITFNANSFVNQSGVAVTGNVTIELIEIFSKKDMILMNAATMGRQWDNTLKPLTSGGEMRVTAKQGGQYLKLAPGMNYQSTMPATTIDPNMGLFYGEGGVTPDTLVWNAADSNQFFGQTGGYTFWSDSMNWVNCDFFNSYPGPQTIVQATPTSGFTNNNMLLFLSVDGINTICNLYGFSGGNFTTAPNYTLPVGMSVHFIAIAMIAGNPHVSIVPATIVNNHIEVLSSLTQMTPAQLATALSNLP